MKVTYDFRNVGGVIMKLFYSFFILFFLSGTMAFSKNSNGFAKCSEFLESLSEGMNACVGSKCKQVWVNTINPSLTTKQNDNEFITNLQQFEVEFHARVGLAAFIGERVIRKNNSYARTIETDPFSLLFQKKYFCITNKENLKFVGSLKY